MPSEAVSLEIKMTAADAGAVRRDYFKQRWPEWLVLLGPLALYFFYLFYLQHRVAVALYYQGWDYDLTEQVTLWGGVFAFFCVFIAAARWLNSKRRRRMLAFQGYRLTISPEGVRMERDGANSDLAWRIIHAVRRGKERTFIYMDSQTAYVIPKRAFKSDAEFADFNEMATRYFNASHSG